MATRDLPQDFHALYDAGVRRIRGGPPAEVEAPSAGEDRLAEAVGDLQVDHDEATGLPNRVTGMTPGARLSAETAGSPEEAVRLFVAEHGDLWHLSPQDAEGIEVTSVSGTRLRTAHLVQRVDGVEVFTSEVTAAVGADDQVVSVAGQFFPGAAEAGRAGRASGISPEQAIAVAASDLTGLAYDAASFVLEDGSGVGTDSGAYRTYRAEEAGTGERPAFERPVRVKDVLFPLGEGAVRPGLLHGALDHGDSRPSATSSMRSTRPTCCSARTSRRDVAFNYRVHNTGDSVCRPEDGPAPGTPHPTGVPTASRRRRSRRQLIEIESLLPGRPWLPAGRHDDRAATTASPTPT